MQEPVAPAVDTGSADSPAPAGSIIAHVGPFAAWIVLMSVLGEPAAWKYALRVTVCLALFVALRPWRWYSPPELKHVLPAFGVGLLVFVVWVAGESSVAGRWPGLRDAYLRVGLMPPWSMPVFDTDRPYAPEECGWALTLVRIAGSSLVIAVIEEFFWRGCVYRLLIARNFIRVPLDRLHVAMFAIAALAFGLEHQRWLAGIVAGCAYGFFLIRTRDIWATAIAHGTTNLLLGIYVVWAGRFEFWG